MLDSHLTWAIHIEHISVRIKQIIAILYRARDLLPRDVRKLLYFSMVHSHLKYMVELWGAASMTYLKRLQVMQNRAIRNVLDMPYSTSRMDLYGNMELNVLPIRGIHECSVAMFVYKRLNGLLLSQIDFAYVDHPYESRNRRYIKKPRCRLNLCQRRVTFTGPTVFNSLPDVCKASVNQRSFQKNCFIRCLADLAGYLTY